MPRRASNSEALVTQNLARKQPWGTVAPIDYRLNQRPLSGRVRRAEPVTGTFLMNELAARTATTLRMYAEHKGWDLADIGFSVQYDLGKERQRTCRVVGSSVER